MLHEKLTERIIKAFYEVYNTLGYGFLEKVYENSLRIELISLGMKAVQQAPIKVKFKQYLVGEYFADLLIENTIIVEIKAVESLKKEHTNQLINYLKSTDKEVGLLLNFGKKPQIVRKIFTNDRKGSL